MRKMLLLSNLGWILVVSILISRCSNSPTQYTTTATTCSTDDFKGVEALKFVKGVARYRRFQWNASNSKISSEAFPNAPFQDARCIWWSLDTLKKFICLIESYAKSDKLRFESKDLGIRFYYAAYDTSESESERMLIKAQVGDQPDPSRGIYKRPLGLFHTLFMVPTYKDATQKENIDFDPRLSAGYTIEQINGHAVSGDFVAPTFDDLFLWNKYKANPSQNLLILERTALSSSQTTFSQNQGRLCPPNCPTGPGATLGKIDEEFPDPKIGLQ